MKSIIKVFQVAFVFIGTIVGAGLASGKEITNFFTVYGYKSFFTIIKDGTMIEFISTNPSVSLIRISEAIIAINIEPIILGIPKYWFNKAPLPASIIDALDIK